MTYKFKVDIVYNNLLPAAPANADALSLFSGLNGTIDYEFRCFIFIATQRGFRDLLVLVHVYGTNAVWLHVIGIVAQ